MVERHSSLHDEVRPLFDSLLGEHFRQKVAAAKLDIVQIVLRDHASRELRMGILSPQ